MAYTQAEVDAALDRLLADDPNAKFYNIVTAASVRGITPEQVRQSMVNRTKANPTRGTFTQDQINNAYAQRRAEGYTDEQINEVANSLGMTEANIFDARKDWMKIESYRDGSYRGGPSGWIRAHIDSAWPLRQKLPEMDFLDAVVGYLQYRIAKEGGLTLQPSLVGWVNEALTRYEKNSDSGQAALATAVGKTLRGFLMVLENSIASQGRTPGAKKAC